MNDFLNSLIETEIRPFLHELAPAGSMMLHAFLYCAVILAAGLLVWQGQEMLRARIEMRPGRSVIRRLRQICVMLLKQPAVPEHAQKTLFVAVPLFAFVFSLFFFFFLPVNQEYFLHPDFSLLYLLFVASCGTYAFITGGWSSATRFSFFGAVRMIAQSLCCQSILTVVVMTILMTAGAPDLYSVIRAQRKIWFVAPHFPLFVLYLLSVAMLLGQAPFEAPKSKRELAGGVCAEYSGGLYLLFLACENILLLLCAALGSVLFLGGTMPLFGPAGLPPFAWLAIKTCLLLFILTLMKYVLPSWRTDRLMNMCFKVFLPFALVWLAGTAGILYFMQKGA